MADEAKRNCLHEFRGICGELYCLDAKTVLNERSAGGSVCDFRQELQMKAARLGTTDAI